MTLSVAIERPGYLSWDASILLWLIGVPIPIVILLAILGLRRHPAQNLEERETYNRVGSDVERGSRKGIGQSGLVALEAELNAGG
jgi:hypothetical protein